MHTLLVKELLLGWVLEDFVCHKLFKDLTMVNLFFNTIFNDKSVYHNLAFLSNSKGTVCCLDIDHGVPVGVKDDNFVGRCQIDAQTPYSSCKQEEVVVVTVIESVY